MDDNEEIKKLLTNPKLFDLIIQELDKMVEDEIPAREIIFLCCCGRLVENADNTSYNLLINDESGSGKDHLCKSIGLLHLNELTFFHRTRITPKALDYWEEDWSNKILYLEDISYDVLNNETMRTFLSSGSHVTLVDKQKVKHKEVKHKPIVLITTASTSPKHELLKRLNILTLDTNINQIKAVAKRKCDLAKQGKVETINPVYIKALSCLCRVKVAIPFADKIKLWIDKIPDENIRVMFMTQMQTILDYIKAITSLYQMQRKPDKNGCYLSTDLDYEIAIRCYRKMISNPFMIPLTKQQQKTIELIREMGGDNNWLKQPDIIDKITWWEQRWSYKQLGKLVDMGILDRDKEKYPDVADKPITILKIKEFIESKLPSFTEL